MTTPTAAKPRPRAKSRATRAAEKATDRPNLTIVPDPQPEPAPEPAKPAGIDAITARLASLNIGQPDPPPASVVNRAAQAAQSPPRPAENLNPNGTKKGTPKAKADAAAARAQATQAVKDKTTRTRQARVTSKVSGLPVNATATYVAVDRFIGTVTVAVEGSDPQVHDCEHGSRNGHITQSPALTCANRLLRNYADGVPGTRTRPRYWGAYQANAEGSEPVMCPCKFGHREQDAAIACAKVQAAQAGLNAA
jgi:hypothetical protein